MRSGIAVVQLDCPDCGSYEMTTGVIAQLRGDEQATAAVLNEIRRSHDAGFRTPHISIETLDALKKR